MVGIGDVELLKKVWEILKTRGFELGLILNPSKCEWSWLDPARTDPCPIEGVAFVPHSEIQMSGVPLGDGTFVSGFVEKKLLGRLQQTVDKLVCVLFVESELQHRESSALHENDSIGAVESKL